MKERFGQRISSTCVHWWFSFVGGAVLATYFFYMSSLVGLALGGGAVLATCSSLIYSP